MIMKKTIFEKNRRHLYQTRGLSYPLSYLAGERKTGIYRRIYLKECRRSVYLNLPTSGGLNDYLPNIEEQAQKRFERIVEQMKQA